MPKVTVVVPNYNHARFLEQRLRSILNQEYSDFELIYLDDASTDNSNAVFSNFSTDRRIRSITNETNSGSPFPQWNKGVREAKGEYIWIAEADDYADPRLLETLVAQLDANPNIGLAYCSSWSVDQDNIKRSCSTEWLSKLDAERWRSSFINSGQDELHRFAILANPIPNASAVVFRREVYVEAGCADETMRFCGDWMLWAKMLLLSDIAYVAEPMNYFRFHSNSVGSTSLSNGVDAEESYAVVSFLLRNGTFTNSTINTSLDYLVDRWLPALMPLKQSLSQRERNIRIYDVASRLDPDIKKRIARKVIAKVLTKLCQLTMNMARHKSSI